MHTNRLLTVLFITTLTITACGGSGGSSGSNSGSADSNESSGSAEDASTSLSAVSNFVAFESGQVRPLALSPSNEILLATNTPAGTLEVFITSDSGIALTHSVAVGMEPVAVAFRNESEAWVVNHLSDSISIVDLAQSPPRVVNTLLVADEPRDIVFAGADNNLAFITTAHRGQNGPDDQPVDAQLTTPGVGRTDVWVFNTRDLGQSLGGDPVTVLSLFGDTARALTVSPDKQQVYVAVMNSGNRSTAIGENLLSKPGPVTNVEGFEAPDTGLIVQFDGQDWIDGSGSNSDLNGTSYDELVPFSLPDYDVFVMQASENPQLVQQLSGVGTNLFNMVTNPVNGDVYVSNTEALNLNRFEGPGIAGGSVRGNFVHNRIAVLSGNSVAQIDLNSHIDRSAQAATDAQKALSISQPLGMAVNASGTELYLTAFGSNKLSKYNTADIANGSAAPSAQTQLSLSGGGPTGVIINETSSQAYVLTRFNNAVVTVDLDSFSELASEPMFNPEPEFVIQGRRHLYRSEDVSRFGDASCASCHLFGDTDGLAWDLGNPDIEVADNPNRFVNSSLTPNTGARFHPMKGPMTTQSLRGLANSGPMHWRGDRTGAAASSGETLEFAAFKEFNGAFSDLLGAEGEISDTDMNQFTRFALSLTYPPNPIRALDNSLNSDQAIGRDIYMNDRTTGVIFTCNDCHVLNPAEGHFGTSGLSSVEGPDISQEFKVPHLRNMYQKVGKFGNSGRFSATDEEFGDQVRGFGFMHDGNMDSLDNFLQGSVFRFDRDTALNELKRSQVLDFVMAMDSNLAPVVGQQVTLRADSGADTFARVDLLRSRAQVVTPASECDLIVHGVIDNDSRSAMMLANGNFQTDKMAEFFSFAELQVAFQSDAAAMTFTCVPVGSGRWMSIDRNDNGVLDGDE